MNLDIDKLKVDLDNKMSQVNKLKDDNKEL